MNDLNDWLAVFYWAMGMAAVLGFMAAMAFVWDAIDRMNDYDKMKKRGFMPLKDDDGDEWWVGYGD